MSIKIDLEQNKNSVERENTLASIELEDLKKHLSIKKQSDIYDTEVSLSKPNPKKASSNTDEEI